MWNLTLSFLLEGRYIPPHLRNREATKGKFFEQLGKGIGYRSVGTWEAQEEMQDVAELLWTVFGRQKKKNSGEHMWEKFLLCSNSNTEHVKIDCEGFSFPFLIVFL